MQDEQFAELLSQLLTLTEKQKRTAISLLSKTGDTEETTGDGPAYWLVHQLERLGLGPPVQAFRRNAGWAKFEKMCTNELDPWISTAWGDLDHTQRCRAYRLFARALCGWVSGLDLPITPRILMQQAAHFRAVVDSAYPGYEAAGLLHLVLN